MAIVLGVVWHDLALVPVTDFELGQPSDLFRQTFDARFAFIIRADREVELVKAHKTVLNLNADLGVVDAFSGRVTYHEVRSAGTCVAFRNRNVRAVRRLRPCKRTARNDRNRRNKQAREPNSVIAPHNNPQPTEIMVRIVTVLSHSLQSIPKSDTRQHGQKVGRWVRLLSKDRHSCLSRTISAQGTRTDKSACSTKTWQRQTDTHPKLAFDEASCCAS